MFYNISYIKLSITEIPPLVLKKKSELICEIVSSWYLYPSKVLKKKNLELVGE